MDDLLWLRQNGLEAAICRYAADGNPVLGICGGYQMMGRRIADPDGVEHGGELRGMGLLPIETVFRGEKTTEQVTGRIGTVGGAFAALSGAAVEGYEIHMGESTADGGAFAELTRRDGSAIADGAWTETCAGTYVHGLFDAAGVTNALIASLRKRRGLAEGESSALDSAGYKQRQYDLLADAVRGAVDMGEIYRIAGLR